MFNWLRVLFLGSALLPALAIAQSAYPDKPIRIINPIPPGSPVEFIGRLVAERLSKAWGKPVLVESRAGAGGTIGANYVAKAAPDAPDGYTLLVTTPSTIAVAPALYKALPYDAVKDFAGIWSVMSAGLMVVVNPKFRFPDPDGIGTCTLDQAKDHFGAGVGVGKFFVGEVFEQ